MRSNLLLVHWPNIVLRDFYRPGLTLTRQLWVWRPQTLAEAAGTSYYQRSEAAMLGPRLRSDCVGSVLISQFLSLLQALFASSISLGKDVLIEFVSDQ